MSLLTSTLWLIFAEIIFTLSGYIVSAGLGRLLGPADYGRYSIVIGLTTMVIIFVGRSIPTAMAKRLSEHKQDATTAHAIIRTAAIIQLVLIATLTIVFYSAAPLIAHLLGDYTLVPLFHLSALIIPAFALSSFHVLIFNGYKRFGAMAALKMSRGLFRVAWILGLAFYFGVKGALSGAIIAPLCVFGIALIIDSIHPLHEKKTKKHSLFSFPYPPQKILSYAGGFMLFTLFYEFYVRTDIYLIKALLKSDMATGIYSAAMTISLIPYYLFFALTFMLFPTISERTKTLNVKAASLIKAVLRFVFLLIMPSAILITFFAQPLVTLFFGEAFASSAALVPLMIGGTVFGAFFYILAAVFNGAGYTYITASIAASAVVISISANMIFLPHYGITATALIFSLTSFLMGSASLLLTYKIFRAAIPLRTIIRVLFACTITAYSAWLLTHTHIFFVISAFIALLIYTAILIVTRELTLDDITYIKQRT